MSDSSMIRVLLISNAGSGFARTVHVESGTTLATMLAAEHGGDFNPTNFVITVQQRDSQPLQESGDYALHNGDRVAVSPAKVAGA